MHRFVASLLVTSAVAFGGDVAFLHVNVVPMDRSRLIEDVTVLVRGGRIQAIGSPELAQDTTRIEARGRYLMPGLADMHVHNWYEEEHTLFLANGVTLIRNLWGTPMHLRWAAEIENGTRIGPALHTSGPILDGERPVWEKSKVVKTPKDAQRIVRELKAMGYPSVKVYNKLELETYRAIVREARAHKMRVTGHVPWKAGLKEALVLRQDCIEHLEGYVRWPFKFERRVAERWVLWTQARGSWNCPTLVVFQKFVPPNEATKLRERPEMRFVPPRLRATWDPTRDFRLKDMTADQFEMLRRGDALRKKVTKMLHDKTGRVLLGTDCGNPFVVAGWSVHEELQNLVDAGLTPFEALECATSKPAEYLGESCGVVKKNARADLILLEQNPLEDVKHAARPLGVMVRGRWLPRKQLDRMLEEVAASYERPRQRFQGLPALPEGDAAHFEVTWNGLVVGEERFVVTPDGRIHAQQANDPPWSAFKTMRITLDKNARITELAASWQDVFGRREHTLRGDAIKDGSIYGYLMLASWVAHGRHLSKLTIGETRDFDYRELTLDTRTEVRSIPLRARRDDQRVYTVWMKYEDATYKSRVVFDPKGLPLRLVTELQQGTVKFERTK